MEVLQVTALLADSAVAAEGKLYVQGAGWNQIVTPPQAPYPFRHSRLAIAAAIYVPWTATNEIHKFEIRLENADGNPVPLGRRPVQNADEDPMVWKIGGNFNVGRPAGLAHGDKQVVPLAANFDGLEFPKPDSYRVVIAIDGTDFEPLTFRVAPPAGVQVMSPPPGT